MSSCDADAEPDLHAPVVVVVDGIAAEPPLALDGDLPSHARASSKRKRVVLSIHDKQQVLQRLEGGEQPMAIARAFGISRQQVSDIKKNRERIVAFCLDAKHLSTLKRKTLKATSEYHPGVEQELYRWIIRQRRLGREVAAEGLAAKTTDLFAQYSADASHTSLKTITTWLRHFKKAHGIKALTQEEVMQLPEQFVPAMEMTRPGDMATAYAQSETVVITTNSGGQVVTQPPGNYFITPASQAVTHLSAGGATQTSIVAAATATTTAALDVSPYMHDIGAQGSVQGVGGAMVPLQATVNTAQQLNAQLARFEREMALKLDYLDERVAKLCYLALSTRLS